MRVHICAFVPAVVEVDIVSPTDIQAKLVGSRESFDMYIDNKQLLSQQMQEMVMLTAMQLITDMLKVKIEERLREKGVSDQMPMSPRGDA